MSQDQRHSEIITMVWTSLEKQRRQEDASLEDT